MKRTSVLSAFLVAVLSFDACDDKGSQPAVGLAAMTDKNVYARGEQIQLTVLSRAGFDANLPSCCSDLAFFVDKQQEDMWREYVGRGLPCEALCPGIQLVVSPGEVHRHDFSLTGSGTYRVRIPFGRGRGSQMAEAIESNTFRIQ